MKSHFTHLELHFQRAKLLVRGETSNEMQISKFWQGKRRTEFCAPLGNRQNVDRNADFVNFAGKKSDELLYTPKTIDETFILLMDIAICIDL